MKVVLLFLELGHGCVRLGVEFLVQDRVPVVEGIKQPIGPGIVVPECPVVTGRQIELIVHL